MRVTLTRMGTISDQGGNADGRPEGITTAMLILTAISLAGRPLTTYEIGLDVRDDHEPPRPLSVIVKSLTKDGYLRSAGRTGKRISRWELTERGVSSLLRREQAYAVAERTIRSGSALGPDERLITTALSNGAVTIADMGAMTGLTTSPIRTALRRISMRNALRRPS